MLSTPLDKHPPCSVAWVVRRSFLEEAGEARRCSLEEVGEARRRSLEEVGEGHRRPMVVAVVSRLGAVVVVHTRFRGVMWGQMVGGVEVEKCPRLRRVGNLLVEMGGDCSRHLATKQGEVWVVEILVRVQRLGVEVTDLGEEKGNFLRCCIE